jgi:hypothetical protein
VWYSERAREIDNSTGESQMTYLADAHRDWHTVNGWDSCPLDCYEAEARAEAAMLATMTDEEIAEYYGE